MTDSFTGRVVVVAGDDDACRRVATALVAGEAVVAHLAADPLQTVALPFRGDVGDRAAWDRFVPHVEQRLGPVDATAASRRAAAHAQRVLGADFRRRGHGGVVTIYAGDDVDDVLTRLADTQRATRR
jgi:hypothetical protein